MSRASWHLRYGRPPMWKRWLAVVLALPPFLPAVLFDGASWVVHYIGRGCLWVAHKFYRCNFAIYEWVLPPKNQGRGR